MNINEILERLEIGNESFVKEGLERKNQDSKRRLSLVKGQKPFAAVLSCADSRVIPEIIFDTGLGELFVVRIAGNVASTEAIASIEYAVANLGVKVIVVLGHQGCGAVAAAIEGNDFGNNLNQLLDHIKPAINSSSTNNMDDLVKENSLYASNELNEKSHIISNLVEKNDVKIVTGFYQLDSGKVTFIK